MTWNMRRVPWSKRHGLCFTTMSERLGALTQMRELGIEHLGITPSGINHGSWLNPTSKASDPPRAR